MQAINTLQGQMGRVAVIGGSEDYTGAPYFSAMASARLGADMVGNSQHLLSYINQQLTIKPRAM
jgi:NAD(P)H-hydrate repair Nnr-like enzyme with NAD(P)H-hydrate dehydratase domain